MSVPIMPGLGSSPVADPVAQTLHQATLTLLERTGVRIGSHRALDLLAAHGVRVDFESRRVYPQEQNIGRALATVSRRMTVYGRGEESPVVLEGDNAYVVAGGGSLRVLTLDGHLETSTWEHLRQFNVLLDALPNIHLCVCTRRSTASFLHLLCSRFDYYVLFSYSFLFL